MPKKIFRLFDRDTFSVGGGVEKREWRHVPVTEIAEGDTVPDVGLIGVVTHITGDHPDNILAVYLEGPEVGHSYPSDLEVFAFVPVRKTDGA